MIFIVNLKNKLIEIKGGIFMDNGEKMILENVSNDIKTLNHNVLYLCSQSASTEARLKNIETIIYDTGDRLSLCESKVNTLRSWGVAIGTIIILLIPTKHLYILERFMQFQMKQLITILFLKE